MQLTKHHGLGNDFLVALDQPSLRDPSEQARRWCDRRTGVGADGLIVAETPADGPVTMRLYNADGSRAEISGNGLRCLIQAVARSTGAERWEGAVRTDAGVRRGWLEPTRRPDQARVRVEMGSVADAPPLEPAELPLVAVGGHVSTVDVGNPHVVIHVPAPEAVPLDEVGPLIEAAVPGGANVHFVMPGSDGSLVVTHWERGAGATRACGSGAVASVYAAHAWGAVGTEVDVHMPGGVARVTLGDPALLEGEATFVATIGIEP